jgi:deoxyguanosine kinase
MNLGIPYRYIAVEGNIGAGKTSLAKMLSNDTGSALLLEEFADNAFLEQFYENPAKFAFPLELSFLAARYKQLMEFHPAKSGQTIISDYHFRKSLLFAEHNLEPAELGLYRTFYEMIQKQIPEPDLVIYLESSVDKLQKNISRRGRDFEKSISGEYLSGIQIAYKKLVKNHPFSRLLIIDCEKLDFVNNQNDYQLIINELLGSNR